MLDVPIRAEVMDPKKKPHLQEEGEATEARRRGVRKCKTITLRRMKKWEIEDAIGIDQDLDKLRPKTRAECLNGPRPCPWVSCKYHLYLDVDPKTGSIKLNFPDIEPHEMVESCALDVADRGPASLDKVGLIMNLTRERIRQLEASAAEKIRMTKLAVEYREMIMKKK